MRAENAPKKSATHAGHRERMRERFLSGGFDNYRPHEVLEQMLFNVLPRVNTNEIAHELLDGGKTLIDVLHTPHAELMKVRGIGEKSAEYIASIIPRMTELILDQYRERGEIDIYGITFLSDWFLGYEPCDRVGIIVCDADRRFIDFRYLAVSLEEDVLDPYKTGDTISAELSAERYYLVWKSGNPHFTREKALLLRDYTSRLGSLMADAYVLDGMSPKSALYQK